MIALVVGAVLLSLAAPDWRAYVANSRMTTATTEFLAAVHFARGEAVKRAAPVNVCVDSNLATAACDGADWADGWKIWTDLDADGDVDSDEILRVHSGLRTDYSVTASVFGSSFRFDALGATGTTGTFTFCDGRGAAYARAVVIAATGQARTSRKDHTGSALVCP